MTAERAFTRIVSLVAELTRAARVGEGPATLEELARRHRVSESTVQADIRTLTLLGDHADADWLLSLCVALQRDLVSITSAGPFRRPVRLSPEERLAVQVALALHPDGAALAARFAALWAGKRPQSSSGSGGEPLAEAPGNVVRRAALDRLELRLQYAGEGEYEGREWRVEPHQVAVYGGLTYIVAYAPETDDWRHFRLDRVLALSVTGRTFAPRPDFLPVERPEDIFRPRGEVDIVRVRFAPSIADWIRERHPDGVLEPDGHVVVRFRTNSPAWLARKVLEYGSDAEVLDPPRYRDAIRRLVA